MAGIKPNLSAIKVFRHTAHASQRQSERGIDASTMELVIKKSPKFRDCGKGSHGGNRYQFKGTIDGKTLVVVAELEGENCWIITGYYED